MQGDNDGYDYDYLYDDDGDFCDDKDDNFYANDDDDSYNDFYDDDDQFFDDDNDATVCGWRLVDWKKPNLFCLVANS